MKRLALFITLSLSVALFLVPFSSLAATLIPEGGACTPGSSICAPGLVCQQYTSQTGNSYFCVPPQSSGAPAPSAFISNTSKTSPAPTSASSPAPNGNKAGNKPHLYNPLKVNSIQELLILLLSFIVKIGSVIVVLMVIIVGFRFVFARGNPSELEKARSMLLWTLVGALIILGAQAIAMGIQATVGAITAAP